jgi:hypothetical protein
VAEFRLTTHLEPSVESRYTETPRDTHHIEEMAGSQSSLEKSAPTPTTPVLSRPPSLLEQEEEDDDDVINSIKLATESRHSFEPRSMMGARHSLNIELSEEDELPSTLIHKSSTERVVVV